MKKIILFIGLVVFGLTLSSCDLTYYSKTQSSQNISESSSSASSNSTASSTTNNSSVTNSSQASSSSTDQEVTFMGGNDTKVAVKSGETYNVLAGVEVWVGLTNRTSDLTYTIVEEQTGNEKDSVSLTYNSTYTVTYKILANGKEYTKVRIITVGSGISGSIIYDINNLHYTQIFADEFDGTSLNSANWSYEVNGDGGGNNELQYYTDRPDNSTVKDGILSIICKKENYLGKQYTSARIVSANKFSFTYGKIQFRAKLPTGVGVWPALWMLGSDISRNPWPNCGEIDVMEQVGYDPDVVHSTIHCGAYNGAAGTQKGSSVKNTTVRSEYHVYTCQWLPDRILFFIDDTKIFEYVPSNTDDASIWPYNKDFFIIMNIAFGGNWGGAQGIDPNFTSSEMNVDYVRVYQASEFDALRK